MGVLTELVVKINGDLSGLQKELDRSTGAIRRFGHELAAAGRTLTLGLTLPVIGLGASTAQAAAQMDSLRRGLTTVSGSAAATEAQLTRLEEVAKLPGLGFREAIQGSVRLQAAGFSAGLAERSLMAFGNALATVGSGKAELDGVTRALTQIATKSKVSAEEINQLAERLPQIRQAMVSAFGTADTEIIQKMGIAPKAFIEALVAQLEKLPRVTGGATNSFENFSDALFRARAAIGERLLPALLPLVEGLTRLLEGVRTVNPETVRWGIALAAVAATVGPLLIAVGSLIPAVAALAAVIGGPITIVLGALAVGLGALSALFIKNKLDALSAAGALDRFKASLIGLDQALLAQGIQSRTRAMVNLESARTRLTNELTQAEAALEIMRRQAPGGVMGTDIGGPTNPHRDFWGRLRQGALPTPEGFDPDALKAQETAVNRLRGLLGGLGTEYGRVRDEFRAMGAQFNAGLQSAATSVPPSLPTTSGADKFAGVLDNLSDRLREFRALAQFGVPAISFLPPDAQEQLRLVNSLSAELDTMTDGLNRLARAGRAAPEGMQDGIAILRQQVEEATQELDRMARQWKELGGHSFLRAIPNLPRIIDPGPLGASSRVGGRDIVSSLEAGISGFKGTVTRVKNSIEALGSGAKAAAQKMAEAAANLKASLSRGIANVAEGSSEFLGNAMQMGSKMMAAGQSLAAAGPAALAFAAAMEITKGAFSVIGPAINALTLPLRIMGEIIGLLIVPVLRILWGPLKLLGTVVSYIGEVIAKVASAIATAIGSLVKGLGKLVNKLPGSPGDPLVKAGQAMIDLGKQFKDAAKEMEERRKELEGLSFEDAMNGVNNGLDKLEEALTNVPPLFNLALRRLQAAAGGLSSARTGGLPEPPQPSEPGAATPPQRERPIIIILDADGNPRPGDEGTRALMQRMVRKLESTPDALARSMAGALRMAG